MKIAIYYQTRIPVTRYGGTERMAANLVRGLAERGHQMTLIAEAGSTSAEATVVPVTDEEAHRPDFAIERFLPAGTDLLLSFSTLRTPPTGVPWALRLGANRKPHEPNPPNTIYVSANHAARHGGHSWVHNGIDPAEFIFRPAKQRFDLFLGRLHSIKGWKWAVTGTRRLRRDLVVAGGWRPSFSRSLRFVGKVGGREKAELLADARLLWMPALWDEPFGITLIEAMASGTPVLGTRRGSLPEVITPDVGRLGDTLEELVALVPECETLSPEACRARFERHFTLQAMTGEYERMLKGFVATGTLPAGRPPEARGE
jgi:glycosyltransferase involved in cell wall biosynthesis